MRKTKYALIGHPVLHSISPFIHKRLFEIAKVDAEYKLIDINSENLEYSMRILKSLDGYNVTIPHKFDVIKFLDGVSERAGLYKSVNTVKNAESSIGYTTDAEGFLRALEYEGIDASGKVVILGCGGVASVIAHELANKGCKVVVAVRDTGIEKAGALAKLVCDNTGVSDIGVCGLGSIPGDVDLLVNATPVGMYPQKDESLVDEEVLKKCRQVYDVVYNPHETKLVNEARLLGIKAATGLSMLVFQAVVSHNIWDGSEYSEGDINQLIWDCYAEIDRGFE